MNASWRNGRAPLEGAGNGEDPVIEALRGAAALMVMATHYTYLLTPNAGIWGIASTGVDLFFVLSGYVFAPYLLGKPLAVVPHLIRRFFRLYPLYLVALLVYVGLKQPASMAWAHFGSHALMAQTLVSTEIASFYNSAFWSLPPEVEYYLLLPLLAWLAVRHGFTPWLIFAAAAHLLLVALATPGEGVSTRAIATIHLPGLLVEFMLGSWAYLMARRAPARQARRVRLLVGAAVFLVVAMLFARYVAQAPGVSRTPPIWVSGNIGLGAALAYAFLVSAVAGLPRSGQGRLLQRGTALFVLMGQLSYSVYLFHNAAPQLLGRMTSDVTGVAAVVLCVGMTLLMAFAAHYAIERPFRNFGRKLSLRMTR